MYRTQLLTCGTVSCYRKIKWNKQTKIKVRSQKPNKIKFRFMMQLTRKKYWPDSSRWSALLLLGHRLRLQKRVVQLPRLTTLLPKGIDSFINWTICWNWPLAGNILPLFQCLCCPWHVFLKIFLRMVIVLWLLVFGKNSSSFNDVRHHPHQSPIFLTQSFFLASFSSGMLVMD